MKGAVLFFDVSNPGFVDLIRQVSTLGLRPVMPAGPFTNLLSGSAVDVETWGELTSREIVERTGQAFVGMLEGLSQALTDPEALAGFDSALGNPLPYISDDFSKLLQVMVLKQMIAIESLDALHERLDLRLIVLGADNTHIERAIVSFARELGIPTLQLAHGLYPVPLTPEAGEMTRLYSDYAAVFGERARRLMIRLGNSPERLIATGAPLWDPLYAERKRMNRDGAARALGLDPVRPIVLYCASYNGSCADFRGLAERQYRTHQVLSEAMRAHPSRPQLVIRPHPNELIRTGFSQDEFSSLFRQYEAWCAGAGQSADGLSIDRKLEVICAADVLVVEGSSAIIPEGMIFGRPIVALPSFDEPVYGPDDGVLSSDIEGLPQVLEELLAPEAPIDELVGRQRRALPDLNHGDDGRATGRVARLIEELAATAGCTRQVATASPPADAARAYGLALEALSRMA